MSVALGLPNEIVLFNTITRAGADPGGSLGSRDPPPEIYQRSQKSDVLV